MTTLQKLAASTMLLVLMVGCNVLNRAEPNHVADELNLPAALSEEESPQNAVSDSPQKVANPPAKSIRFDGREIVLGTADVTQMSTPQFCAKLAELVSQNKWYTARRFILKNPGAAEQAMWERGADSSQHAFVPFLAKTLSEGVPQPISWDSFLRDQANQSVDRKLYHQTRLKFAEILRSEEPTDSQTQQLRDTAQKMNHPLVMVDALRLIALRELVAGRHAWAESMFLQAAEIADQHGDLARAAECWLMATATANRTQRGEQADKTWTKAAQRQVQLQSAANRPLNIHFWTRLEKHRPEGVAWPDRTGEALLDDCACVGCDFDEQASAELVFWCAIAAAQYEYSHPQMALVSFKRAETLADGDNALWLKIAQSKCLAALGQSQAAAALLSGPAASENARIATAATAAIGSAKLQAGAYQQGAQLIHKALKDSPEITWPSRSEAEADLALALLIIGDTDDGLEALHSVQDNFRLQGNSAALLQSLENERKILELEQRQDALKVVQQRIEELENSPSTLR